MKMWIDTEFNGFEGALISMAIVAEDGNSFYEVLELPTVIHPWVQQNVVPILNQEPVSYGMFQEKLFRFLRNYDKIELIADWPDDIKYFCKSIITGPGHCMNLGDMTFHVKRLEYISRIPHNALEDAIGIMIADVNKSYEN